MKYLVHKSAKAAYLNYHVVFWEWFVQYVLVTGLDM